MGAAVPTVTALLRRSPAIVACLVVVAACGVDDPPGAGRTADPPATTALTTALSQADADEAQLRQLAADWYESLLAIYVDEADPRSAEAYLTGEYLERFLDQVEDRRRQGLMSRRDDRSREVVETLVVASDTATLRTCNVDANVLLAADGTVLNDDVGTFRFETRATVTAAGWRFSQRIQLGEMEEGDRCDE